MNIPLILLAAIATVQAAPYCDASTPCANGLKCIVGACDSAAITFTPTLDKPVFDYKDFYQKTPLTGGAKDHTPAGMPASDWVDPGWDGVPMTNPTGTSTEDFHKWLCPSGPQKGFLRGLSKLYSDNPVFTDPLNPTQGEIDYWNRIVMRYARRLIGLNEAQVPFDMDVCLAARSVWADEYKFSTKWGNNSVTCAGKGHCGFSFVPTDPNDQTDYLAENNVASCQPVAGSEGILLTRSRFNWGTKLAGMICMTVAGEKWTGHAGPLFRRTLGGLNFLPDQKYIGKETDTKLTDIVRAKFSGKLIEIETILAESYVPPLSSAPPVDPSTSSSANGPSVTGSSDSITSSFYTPPVDPSTSSFLDAPSDTGLSDSMISSLFTPPVDPSASSSAAKPSVTDSSDSMISSLYMPPVDPSTSSSAAEPSVTDSSITMTYAPPLSSGSVAAPSIPFSTSLSTTVVSVSSTVSKTFSPSSTNIIYGAGSRSFSSAQLMVAASVGLFIVLLY